MTVGIGSSAGGLDALKRFFRAMSTESGMAFVLVQHLDPTHGSLLAELIARSTEMPVVQVEATTPLEANHVYCIPPGRYLTVSEGTLRLTPRDNRVSVRMPIDIFLRALADDAHERGIGLLLSGTGTDGTIGLRAIRGAGGVTLVQDPNTAEHDGMLRSAIVAGVADYTVSPEAMPGILLEYSRRITVGRAGSPGPMAELEPDQFDEVLAILREHAKFDFQSYKRSTLQRRLARRMSLKHVEGLPEYCRVLRDEPAEVAALSRDLLISVTSFFRDPKAWRFLEDQVLRPMVQDRAPDTPLRVWVAACATGEEAYSIAIVLLETLRAVHKTGLLQVFASDVDGTAIDFARAGLYPQGIATDVSEERLRRFFVPEGPGFRVSKELRELVVFARQNLLVDPPFSRLDLICCRNTLMYLNADAQKRVVALLHSGLLEGGHLFLGSAETIGDATDMFAVVSKQWRIYRRIGPTRHDQLGFSPKMDRRAQRTGDPVPTETALARVTNFAQLLLLERFAPASVLVNPRYEILYYAGPTQDYLRQPTGAPTQDLLLRARDGLRPRLRRAIRTAIDDNRRTVVTGARVRRGDLEHRVTITAEPVRGPRETEGLLLVWFTDEPGPTAAGPDGAAPATEREEPVVRQLEHELETTRADLQGSISELENSNQELKVANEEIMSVNEEMRSTNEELETAKEELQSLNEELTTVNAQLQEKVLELEAANNDLDNLLTSTNIPTLFLDRSFRVRRFTPSATRLFNLIPADVGRPLGDVTQRCVDPDLRADAETVLARLTSVSKEVQGHDGRWYVRQVQPYRTHDDRIEGIVITFSDVAAEALQEARLYSEVIVDTIRESLVVLDCDLCVQSANRAFYQMFRLSPEVTVGRSLFGIEDGQMDLPALRAMLAGMLPAKVGWREAEIEHTFAQIGWRVLRFHARTLARGGGRPDLILLAIEDVTEQTRAERLQHDSEIMARAGIHSATDGIVTVDRSGTIMSFNPAAERIFGYSAQEMIGQSAWLLVPVNDREAYQAAVSSRLRPEMQPPGGDWEIQAQRKNGPVFPLEIHVSAFEDTAGLRFVCTVRDVTQRKAAEELVRRRQAELAHVLRVATVERLAAGLAHELNQPLAAVVNELAACATEMRSAKSDPPKLLAMVERAGAEALRAGGIVQDLRQFVKRTQPRLDQVNLCDVVRHGIHWLAREIEHERITLLVEMPPQPVLARVDRIQIEQVIVNLTQNAIDAIVATGGETRRIEVRVSAEAARAEVAIEDTGVGLESTVTEHLYEPFFTTKPNGMGLGLAICRTILELHEGTISIAPRPSGPGTTVRISLPLGSGDAAAK